MVRLARLSCSSFPLQDAGRFTQHPVNRWTANSICFDLERCSPAAGLSAILP